MDNVTSPAVVVLTPADNVAIACRSIAIGDKMEVPSGTLTATTPVPLAHKISLRALAVGDKVIRSGVPIGSVTRPIAAGEHVHTQNLVSDYIPTFTLETALVFEEPTP